MMRFYRAEDSSRNCTKSFGESMSELYSNFQGYLQLNIPRIKWVLVFGVLFFAVFYFLNIKRYVRSLVGGIVLSFDCSFIFVMTLFGRRIGGIRNFDLEAFDSYYVAFVEGNMEVLLQILVNIAMYIPLGFLLPCCFRFCEKYRYTLLVAIATSVVIELIQVIFKIGWFEVDDIINNTLGAVIGIIFSKTLSCAKMKLVSQCKV